MRFELGDKKTFLAAHNLTQAQFDAAGVSWEKLAEISAQHASEYESLERAAAYFLSELSRTPAIHSVKLRIKNPASLVAKIIRKASAGKFKLGHDYRKTITDLVGVRALHLFKDDWSTIHDNVREKWALREKPTAYFRAGDSPTVLKLFREKGCRTVQHEFGYRSVHYLLRTQPGKEPICAELQVRTLFEEAWSEIDHRFRYPNYPADPRLTEYLQIFNRVAGNADEMGTFIRQLSSLLEQSTIEVRKANEKITNTQKELRDAIANLDVTKAEKAKLAAKVEELRKLSASQQTAGSTLSLVGGLASAGNVFGPATAASYPTSGFTIQDAALTLPRPRCRTCNREQSITDMLIGGQCSVCSTRVLLQQTCSNCGRPFTPSSIAILQTECDSCRTRPIRLS